MKRTHESEVQTPATSHEQESVAPSSQRFPRQTNADSSAKPLHRTTQGWEGGKRDKTRQLYLLTVGLEPTFSFTYPLYLIGPIRPLPNSTSLMGSQLN